MHIARVRLCVFGFEVVMILPKLRVGQWLILVLM